MNECEQIHPLLRGYLNETLSARDRRVVARHLNLCASARKELEKLRSGPVKSSSTPVEKPVEPWDMKILRWLFKAKKPVSVKPVEIVPKKSKENRPPVTGKKATALKPILGIVIFFVALVFLTHFIQNAGDNRTVKEVKRWLSQNGYHVFGINSSLELVLDLTSLPHWSGDNAPVAFSCRDLITDADHFKIYWPLLQPGLPLPDVDFNKTALAVVFLGQKPFAGETVKFKRLENFTDKTILWYDEIPANSGASAPSRPWVLQEVPKPTQRPVLIQKIQ